MVHEAISTHTPHHRMYSSLERTPLKPLNHHTHRHHLRNNNNNNITKTTTTPTATTPPTAVTSPLNTEFPPDDMYFSATEDDEEMLCSKCRFVFVFNLPRWTRITDIVVNGEEVFAMTYHCLYSPPPQECVASNFTLTLKLFGVSGFTS